MTSNLFLTLGGFSFSDAGFLATFSPLASVLAFNVVTVIAESVLLFSGQAGYFRPGSQQNLEVTVSICTPHPIPP